MLQAKHTETPRAVSIRIFGACAILLGAMLVLVQPAAVMTAIHAMMTAGN